MGFFWFFLLNMLRSSFFSSFLAAPFEKSPLHMAEPSQPCLYNFMQSLYVLSRPSDALISKLVHLGQSQ